jgi:hypothetical protein
MLRSYADSPNVAFACGTPPVPRDLKEAFFRVADRSLDAAEAAADKSVQEKAGFLAYHSFESCGGAFCNARGIHFHPASHLNKVRNFIQGARKETFAREAAQLAAEVSSLRNAFLYPKPLHGAIHMPEDTITVAQARRLIGRLRTLASRMKVSV